MLNELKKKSIKTSLILTGVFIIVAILGTILTTPASFENPFLIFEILSGPKKISDYPINKLKGKYIEDDIYTIMGSFAETKNKYGSSTSQYYIVSTEDTYIGIKVPDYLTSNASQTMEELYNYLGKQSTELPSAFHFEGYTRKMKRNEEKYFREWFELNKEIFSDDALKNQDSSNMYTQPLMLVYKSRLNVTTRIMLFVMGILVLSGIAFIIIAFTGGSQKKLRKYIYSHGGPSVEYIIDSDYKNGRNIQNNVFGKEFIISNNFIGNEIICIKDIIWCHPVEIKTRYTTNYSLSIYTSDKGKYSLHFANRQMLISAIQEILKIKPYLPHEKTNEFSRLYKSNFIGFINMVNKAKSDFLNQNKENSLESNHTDSNTFDTNNTYNNFDNINMGNFNTYSQYNNSNDNGKNKD